MTVYGYARVSSPGQEHERQLDALRAAGADQIFREKASAAADRARPALALAIKALEPGDVLIVTALDRLARSARDALNHIAAIHARGARFRSLAESWADTTTPQGQLAVTIFAGFAEFDRAMILSRTAEGRAQAQARGVRLGRPPKLNATQYRAVREAMDAPGGVNVGELARVLGVSRKTVRRAMDKLTGAAVNAGWAAPGAGLHNPDCAMHSTGLGAPVRCTCGRDMPPLRQADIEELTREVPRV